MTDKMISSEQVAVLAERVDTLLLRDTRTEGLILGISASLTSINERMAVLGERHTEATEKHNRIFSALKHQDDELEVLKSDMKVNAWAWKLVGSAVTVCVAAAGFGWTFMGGLAKELGDHEKRISIIEFVTSNRPDYVAPPKRRQDTKE